MKTKKIIKRKTRMRFKHTAVGGTFDNFHKGHKKLLKTAFGSGDLVSIGITSDDFAQKGIESYEKRKEEVMGFLKISGLTNYNIIKLEDPYGPALNSSSIEALIVSDETYPVALRLNLLREKYGLNGLEIIRVPMVCSEDGGLISSSRIRKGEIDPEGKII